MILNILTLMALTIYVLVKELVIPRRNSKNPISFPVFYEKFKQFRKSQELWNTKTDRTLEKIDERVDKIEKEK